MRRLWEQVTAPGTTTSEADAGWGGAGRCHRRRSAPDGGLPPGTRALEPGSSRGCLDAAGADATPGPRAGLWIVAVGGAAAQFEHLRALGATLLASAGVVGVVMGIAARSTLGNVVAGAQIAFTQPIRVGDVVTLRDETGEVEDITLAYTFIRTLDNRRLAVPNEVLNGKILRNYNCATHGRRSSRPRPRRLRRRPRARCSCPRGGSSLPSDLHAKSRPPSTSMSSPTPASASSSWPGPTYAAAGVRPRLPQLREAGSGAAKIGSTCREQGPAPPGRRLCKRASESVLLRLHIHQIQQVVGEEDGDGAEHHRLPSSRGPRPYRTPVALKPL